MRYITLKTAEIEILREVLENSTNHIYRKRSHCLLLSHRGRTIVDLASIFEVDIITIEHWFDKWEKEGPDTFRLTIS